jgi:hypothetical protein
VEILTRSHASHRATCHLTRANAILRFRNAQPLPRTSQTDVKFGRDIRLDRPQPVGGGSNPDPERTGSLSGPCSFNYLFEGLEKRRIMHYLDVALVPNA